ncbi:MAG: hypothetical protein HFE78_08365 [Clostridiales bacterium]|nr:hypothetical protein [Clostridiales bacterium]
MERMIKIGRVMQKNAAEIAASRFGIGFEKLDRDVFNPENAYDKLAALGVKWVRIQSGWARSEKEKGVYDFSWIDRIVDNLLERGLVPWVNLVYGNGLYDEEAAKYFGAVGCPPVKNEEMKKAWADYITALAVHLKGRVCYYEVWNEPDGKWCWKHGPDGKEYGRFVIDTAIALKKGDPNAKIIGGALAIARPLDFTYDAFSVGMGQYIDALSYHEYTIDETIVLRRVKALRGLCDQFNPQIEIIQGESGAPSRSDGMGALNIGAWTPHKQAKLLLRHLMADLIAGVKFTSYFSCVDMIEALHGTVGNLASYLDYGYFGVLGAEFDAEGHSVGSYAPKASYYALQALAAAFAGDFRKTDLPILRYQEDSARLFGMDCDDASIIEAGFARENGSAAYVYWNSTPLLTTDFESTVSFCTAALKGQVRLIDLMDGAVYELPEGILENRADGKLTIHNLPIKDYPMALTFGDFMETESINR